MPSIGELFVELGVVGNTKELKKTLADMKEGLRLTQKEIALNKLKLKLINDIAKAQSPADKKRITSLYLQERKAILDKDNIANVDKQISGHKALASNIAGVVKGVGLFVGALTGAAVALNNLTNSLVSSNQAMLDLTRTTDIAQGTFQKWGSIGKMLGVENADQQLASLNQRLFDLMLTGEGARGFQLAGINPMGQDAEGVLEQLRARVSGMDDTTATYLLQQMGLDPKMLHLLRMSRSEFEALGQTIKKYQLSPEQTKQIQAMNMQIQIAGIQLRYLKDKAILAMLPYWVKFLQGITKVVDKFTSFVKWVKQGTTWGAKLTKIVLGLAAGFAAWSATTVIVAKTIGFVTTAVKALQGVLLLLTAHPIIAGLTLLAGALYLIADDISHYMNGGGSLIGVIMNGLKDLDLKGFIDFPVPKWLEYLIEVIHFYQSGGFNNGISKEDLHKDIINEGDAFAATSIDTADPRKRAAIKRIEQVEKIKNNPFLNFDAKNDAIIKLLTTPQMERNLSYNTNNTSNTDNRQINQTISIQSNQPAFDIQNQLSFARNAITSGWA